MAGHSKWANIRHRKGAQDAKRGKLFTKLIREIFVAAKKGADPVNNPSLRSAMDKALTANMKRDTIDTTIKKASGSQDGVNYDEVLYEGYGPGGTAVMVECLTDNRNRTVSEVRTAFSKNGGALAETNSVAFQFNRVGQINYAADIASGDDMLEAAIDVGADDCLSDELVHEFVCPPDDFHDVRDALEARFGSPESAGLAWKPTSTVPIDEDKASTLFKMIEALEDSDDVQNVSTNFDVADDIIEKLSA